MSTTPSGFTPPGASQTHEIYGTVWHDAGSGQQPPAGPTAPAGPPAKKHRALRWLAPALGLVLVAGGGAYGATKVLASPQPDEVIPANAITYVRVDVDPSLGQKVAAVRFLHQVPDVKDVLSGSDFRKEVFLKAKQQNPELRDVDYDRDVKPWLGDRLGIALLPPAYGAKEPSLLVALQVKDEQKARAGLQKLLSGDDQPDVAFRDGYALLIDKGQKSWLNSYLADGSLADNAQYVADMKALGNQGVVSGWADLRKINRLSDQSTPAAVEDAVNGLGRTAFALRFDPGYLELAGVVRGMKSVSNTTTDLPSHLADLPANTAVALQVSRPDQAVAGLWKQLNKTGLGVQKDFRQQVADIERGFGVTLPRDLQTVVGKRLVLAAPAQQLSPDGMPTLGLRVQTDATRANGILSRVDRQLRQAGMQVPIHHTAKGGELVVATSGRYLDQLSRPGTLGQNPAFRKAVADPAHAAAALFVDLDKVEGQYLPQIQDKDARAFAKTLSAVGFSASVQDDGDVSFQARLVGD